MEIFKDLFGATQQFFANQARVFIKLDPENRPVDDLVKDFAAQWRETHPLRTNCISSLRMYYIRPMEDSEARSFKVQIEAWEEVGKKIDSILDERVPLLVPPRD